jgi:hypothetical protein
MSALERPSYFIRPVRGFASAPKPTFTGELKFHSMDISVQNEKFIKSMIIQDKQAASFISEALSHKNASYFILYHNEEKAQIADGLGVIFSHGDTTYILPYFFSGSKIKEFYLTSLFLDKYPKKIITWEKLVNLDKQVHDRVYVDSELNVLPVPEERIREVWPFTLPSAENGKPKILKTKIPLSFTESFNLFRNATRFDQVFSLKAKCMFIHTLGESVMMGSIFYFVLNKLQSLTMLAPLMLLERFIPLVTTPVNSHFSKKLDDVEDKQKLMKKTNSEVPFLNLWVKYLIMKDLVEQNKQSVLAKSIASSLFFGIYMTLSSSDPEIRKIVTDSAIFTAYLSSLALDWVSYTVEEKNMQAVTETQFDETKYENKFWQIYSIYQNYTTILQIVPFMATYGICWLAGNSNPTMTSLASAGFALTFAPLLFLKYAKERTGVFLQGSYNIRADNYFVMQNGVKVREVDEKHKLRLMPKDGGIFLPDIDPARMKIVVKEEPKITTSRSHWLTRILTLGLINKKTVTIKSGDEMFLFTLFGRLKQNLAELFELERSDENSMVGPPKEKGPSV